MPLDQGLFDLFDGRILREHRANSRLATAHERAQPDDPFWLLVKMGDDCWEWQGGLNGKGYGRFKGGGAHRHSWRITNGEPGAMFVCHRCDTPACVRPDHLFLGTALDNNRDRVRKGRPNGACGERNVNAKLTAGDVRAIRAALEGARNGVGAALARKYGVGEAVITRIKAGTVWKCAL